MAVKKTKATTKTKKKATPVAKVKRTTRTRQPKMEALYLVPVTFRRVIYFTACLLLVVAGTLLVQSNGNVTQAVAGVSIARGVFSQVTINLPHVEGAVSYNIYYKEVTDGKFINAVRNVSASTTTYTISYLKHGKQYHYKISALDKSGKEFWWSKVTLFTNLQSM